jgi:23S rRNA (guanosine2251-2'-O)-methyltransferase
VSYSETMPGEVFLIAHNIRSSHNIGSLLRTAEGLGVSKVFITGYSPYPKMQNDQRLPHLVEKQAKQITKTALGAESFVDWQYQADISKVIDQLRKRGFTIVALEQTKNSKDIRDFQAPQKTALIVGNEIDGLDRLTLAKCDEFLQLPMAGRKESFNVVVAAAMALYSLKLKGDGQID